MKKVIKKPEGDFCVEDETYSIKEYERRILNDGGERSLRKKFILTSVLYVTAAISECTWFYILYKYQDSLVEWIKEVPFLGWIFVFIFACMFVIIPCLAIIGVMLFRLTLKSNSFSESALNRIRRRNVNLLLVVGIIADLCIPPILIDAKDQSAVILCVALFGGRILLANFVAVEAALVTQKSVR